jgi:prepilin-type N-terminal cleavage/methylation domain-containing protein
MNKFRISSFKFHHTGGKQQVAKSQQQPDMGFTLMEILVATAILAIVVTTVLASFNAVFSTTEVLDDSADIYAMAKNCLKRMALDLESIHVTQRPIYKPPELDQPPDPYRFVASAVDTGGTGFAQNLRFTSRAHVGFEKIFRQGIAEVIYYVKLKKKAATRHCVSTSNPCHLNFMITMGSNSMSGIRTRMNSAMRHRRQLP